LEVYNIAGQKVTTLASGMMAAGYHRVSFAGSDDSGNQLASGIYLYRLVTDNFSETKKMLLIK
ncbi:MAG: T9SS type A sorting domain-containing protein, partial [candidate division Zixibacteria bacterium]|nr:T9SS type A sorting domain-containing protein [candidate division Zixibacteria bacterium]